MKRFSVLQVPHHNIFCVFVTDRGKSVFIQSYISTIEFAKHAIYLADYTEAEHCHFYQQVGSKLE